MEKESHSKFSLANFTKIQFSLLTFFLFGLHTSLYANDITPYQNTADSLVIQKNNSKKEVIIHAGRKIKVWQKNNKAVKGILKEVSPSFILITSKDKEVKIPINEIQKLRIVRSTTRKIISWTLIAAGAIGMTTGVLFLVIASTTESGLGIAIAAIAAGVTGGTGMLFLGGGGLLGDRTFDLQKKWSIQHH